MIVLIGGCSPRYRVSSEPPLLTATVQELVARLDERTRSIQTLKALVTIRSERQPAVTASLSFSRSADGGPPSLRLKGFDPFGRTLFDLVSTGDRVRLTIPGEGRVLEGGPDKREDPSLPVQSAELRLALSALVGPFVEPGEIPVVERTGAVYLIHLVRVSGAEGRLTKRLWFERSHLTLEREELFQEKGHAATIVEFYDYRSLSGVDWPDRITITRRQDEFHEASRVTLEFHEVRPNAVIPPTEFQIP
ncbi:MAG TPA: hypothetical protein VIL61_00615 [Nitrospiria bacterium]